MVLLIGSSAVTRAQNIDAFMDADASPPEVAQPAPATAVEPPPSRSAVAKSPAAPDRIGMDALFEDGTGDLLDPSDWAPEHARGPRPTVAAKVKSEGVDPEPDTAVAPAVPAPAKDPLDKPKGVAAAPAPAAPLTPLEAAIKATLEKRAATPIKGAYAAERRKEREAVELFYAAHDYAPVWSQDGRPVAAVEPVLARLGRAGDDALSLPNPPRALAAQGTPEAVAQSEIALSEAVVFYARQATGARVDPRTISPLIGARPELADPAEVLDATSTAGDAAGDTLEALNPSDPRYAALREKLAASRGAGAPVAGPISEGPVLKIGMQDARVPSIRARLGLGVALDGDGLDYDIEVAEAVAGFQRANGLPVSGQLTRRTVAAMSGAPKPARIEGTLVANMEMWRWMPRELGADRIEVNVPDFLVTVFHDGAAVATNRVVVGKTDTPTPLFSSTMKYLIVNPVWNVPESIIKKEFMPKTGGDLSALRGFDVTYSHGRAVVKQPSGAKNALGRIKFIFPNNFSVYLHDTPSKPLFAASRRAFSHGCVRVDKPFDFAFDVLNDGVPEGGKVLWSEKRLSSLLGDKERYVNLPKALPIHIEYFTASVDPDSAQVRVREDIYGYARAVAVALGEAGEPAVVAERKPKPKHVAVSKVAADPDEDPR